MIVIKLYMVHKILRIYIDTESSIKLICLIHVELYLYVW